MKEKRSLLELWEERKRQFEQCMELQQFLRDANQAENWVSKHEVHVLTTFAEDICIKTILLIFNF